MKKIIVTVLAVLMVLPMLFSCASNEPTSTKYGTAEKAVNVKVVIVNTGYVPPTTEAEEGEEPEVDVNNPEFYYNGKVELYVTNPTVEDALNAVFAMIKENYACSIDENNVTITDYADNFNVGNFWVYTIANKEVSLTQTLVEGNTINLNFNFADNATQEATQEATTAE